MGKDTKKQVAAAAGVAGAAGIGAAAAMAATTVGQPADSVQEENPTEPVEKESETAAKAPRTTKVVHENEVTVNNGANDETQRNTTLEEARQILQEETSNENILTPPFILRPVPQEPIQAMYAAPMDPNGWDDPYGIYRPEGPGEPGLSGDPYAAGPYAVDPYAVGPDHPVDVYEPENPGEIEEPSLMIEDVYAGPMPPEIYAPELPEDPTVYENPGDVYGTSPEESAPSEPDAGPGADIDFQGDF